MDLEIILWGAIVILVDALIIYYAVKKIYPIWKRMKADGKITLKEIEDAVEEVVDIIEETKEEIGENHGDRR